MIAKEEAKKLKNIFLKQLLTATPSLYRPHYQAKEMAKIHIDLMIEKMNSYSDLESHLYQNCKSSAKSGLI